MNPIIQLLLTNVFNVIETLIQSEGPAVLAWIQAEVAALEAKYTAK